MLDLQKGCVVVYASCNCITVSYFINNMNNSSGSAFGLRLY